MATSTKDNLIVHAACALRPERPVYVFDPTGFSEWPDPWAGIRSPGARIPWSPSTVPARSTLPPGGSRGIQHADYFLSCNEATHSCYLRAATVSRRDIVTVRQWVTKAAGHDASRSLRERPVGPE